MDSQLVENTIVRFCSVPRDFGFLSANMSGMDPVFLHEQLTILVNEKKLKKMGERWGLPGYRKRKVTETGATTRKASNLVNSIPYFDVFKKSHPLDYEWRNSLETLDFLCEIIKKDNDANDNVLLLGMPSVFIASYYKKLKSSVTLVDKNEPLMSHIGKLIRKSKTHGIINDDIFSLEPDSLGKYNSIFIDPPWYSDHFFHFIWLASKQLQLGGVLAISLPPMFTRPEVLEERKDWFAYCNSQGLVLESLYSQNLEYMMPFFEFNAFRAAGIRDILPFWRKGDFAIFRKVDHIELERPLFASDHNLWKEFEIKDVRFRVLVQDQKKDDGIEIEHLVNGDILPSVSSRDPRRKDANIWTSGNRIFRISNPTVFFQYGFDYSKNTLRNDRNFKLITEFIDYVTEIENKEYINYKDWLTYEMEGKGA